MINKNKYKLLSVVLKVIIVITSFLGIASIIVEYGFRVNNEYRSVIHYISIAVVIIFFVYQLLQYFISTSKSDYLKTHKIESLLLLFIIAEIILSFFDFSIVEQIGIVLHFKDLAFLYVVFAQIFIVIGLIGGGLRYNKNILKTRLHPSRLFVLSFIITIVMGTLLLLLPAATVSGNINILDALFTSTSAVCVTGLITVDTATYFTTFGQVVILGLFQIGGLGLMTFTTFFALFLAGGMGIRETIMLHDLLDEENIGAITKVLSFLTITTFVVELIGAGILFLSVQGSYSSPAEAIFPSIFHSISAFCNAGFSVFTDNLMDESLKLNYLYSTVISFLIILGGIGFPTIMSFRKLKFTSGQKVKLPIQTKIVVYVTIALIIIGTIVIYIFESGHALNGLNPFEKVFAAYFQSVTSRTAGFNTINIGLLTAPTTLFFLFLMFVGASPGGTGGGIKTTTFAILFISIISILRDEKNVVVSNRRIRKALVLRALLKTFISICFISTGIFLLALTEKMDLLDLSFEAFSAFGTVGLSRGITGSLSEFGKFWIILLMFIGRVGPLAFIFSMLKTKEAVNYDLPSENISIM